MLFCMNPPKCNEYDYINFLMAAPRVFSCAEAEKVQPDHESGPSHDSINRLLYRLSSDTEVLWREAAPFTDKGGFLISDDSALDKPYAKKIQMVTYHWSGKHHSVVKGINLVTLLWTDGDAHIPCDYRIYHKEADGKTKNQHFADMLYKAEEHGACPQCVLFDSWYSGIENLKLIREPGWQWLTRLKANRSVNPDGKGNVALSEAEISEFGSIVHLKGYGFIKVFGIVAKDGGTGYWATSDIGTDELRRIQLSEFSWKIEEYHRGLKQFCGAERSFVRLAGAQRNHIGLSIRAFLRFEVASLKTGISWFGAKIRIIRDAVRAYLRNPIYALFPTA
jgi:putative transposase